MYNNVNIVNVLFKKCECFNKKKPKLVSLGFTIQNKCAINHILKMIQLSCLG